MTGIGRLAVVLLLALAPAAHAVGSDPLLSGYGGPGDGEQALLGETLIPGAPSGDAGAGQGAPAAAPAPDAIYAPASQDPMPVTEAPVPGEEDEAVTPAPRPSRHPGATRPVRPGAPAIALSTGGDPAAAPSLLAGPDVALVVALVLGLAALAGAARRLAVGAARARRPASPQVP